MVFQANVVSAFTNNVSACMDSTFSGLSAHLAKELEVDEENVKAALLSYKSSTKAVKVTKKGGAKKKKDPLEPKKNQSGYLFFCGSRRLELQNDGNTFREIGALMGKEWKELDAEPKKEFQDMATADKERYINEMKEYAGGEGVTEKPVVVDQDDKVKGKISEAKSKSSADEDFCYNLSTKHILKYSKKTSGDRVWNIEENICAKTQQELDDYLGFAEVTEKKKKVVEKKVVEKKVVEKKKAEKKVVEKKVVESEEEEEDEEDGSDFSDDN